MTRLLACQTVDRLQKRRRTLVPNAKEAPVRLLTYERFLKHRRKRTVPGRWMSGSSRRSYRP
jgi:hypothetical protein